MSKLYNEYLKYKNSNSTKIYLFKSGIFYIALEQDAIYLSGLLGFKLTNLNENVVKCGFPISHLRKYVDVFKSKNIAFKIIDEKLAPVKVTKDYLKNVDIVTALKKIDNLDINKTSPIECFNLINELKHILK